MQLQYLSIFIMLYFINECDIRLLLKRALKYQQVKIHHSLAGLHGLESVEALSLIMFMHIPLLVKLLMCSGLLASFLRVINQGTSDVKSFQTGI